jgi:osmotically-inducible protein OsmY
MNRIEVQEAAEMLKRTSVLLCAFALSISSMAFAQTDAALTASVKSKLAADETVKASQVNVSTDAHVVTLSGAVDSKAAKERALAIARDTSGVTSVVDKLTVKDVVDKSKDTMGDAADKTGKAVGTAAKETGKAVDKAAKETGKAVDKAADKVSGGAEKSTDATKKAGEKTAATLTDAEITTAVKTKLLGDGTTPGLKIDVDTKDHVVTLSGDVQTAAARTQAVSLARDTKGVKSVINKLTVAGK